MVPCTLKLHSDNWAHDWTCVFRLQVGVPPMPGQFVVAIDTGSVSLSVCAIGSIGYDEPAQTQGSGFQVPKGSANTLYFGGMMAGNDGSYLVDHFYSRPASGATNHDWRLADSLRFVLPASPADEHWTNSMTDAGHPTPKGLAVEQHWYMNAVNGYRDWAIAAFDFTNNGSSAINGVYAAMVGDFDIGTSTSNVAGSDTVRRSVWMEPYGSETPTVGFVLLDPDRFANLSAIDHALYVYPTSALTDTQKYQFMNGTIVLRQSDRSYDWSIITSAGPFNLPVGAEQRVAFAVVGATSLAQWLAFGDSAQHWYNANMLGIVEQPVQPSERQPVLLSPNPFARGTCVRYFTSAAGELELVAFDATGRQVELVRFPVAKGTGTCYWQPKGLAPGIYFLKVKTPDRETTQKALLTE